MFDSVSMFQPFSYIQTNIKMFNDRYHSWRRVFKTLVMPLLEHRLLYQTKDLLREIMVARNGGSTLNRSVCVCWVWSLNFNAFSQTQPGTTEQPQLFARETARAHGFANRQVLHKRVHMRFNVSRTLICGINVRCDAFGQHIAQEHDVHDVVVV